MTMLLGSRRPKPRPVLAPGAWVASPNIAVTRDRGPAIGTSATVQVRTFVPATYRPGFPHPVAIELHGSGEISTDPAKLLAAGLGPVCTARASTFPAIVVKPQLPDNTYQGGRDCLYPAFPLLLAWINATYTVDPRRIYLLGYSTGGLQACEMAYLNPTKIAALLIAPGYCNSVTFNANLDASIPAVNTAAGHAVAAQALLAKIPTLPTKQYESSDDQLITPSFAQSMRDQWLGVNPNYGYVQQGAIGHTEWDAAYADASTFTWLFSQTR